MEVYMIKTLNSIFYIAAICLCIAAAVNYGIGIYNAAVERSISQKNKNKNQKKQQRLTRQLIKKNQYARIKNDPFELDHKVYIVILIAIAVIGVAVRVWKFGSVPGGFNQDGAMAAVDGKALAEYGTDRFGTWLPAHLYAWGYGQMSSLLSYFIAFFVKLFGLNPITARLPQLLASLMGGTFLYLFMRDNFGKGAALIAAAFTAINPWHLLQSRWALDCNLLPHFFMGGLYFISKGLSGKKKFIYISMIFFGLCMYCYGITIYTIPVFLLITAVYYFIRKRLTLIDILIAAGIYLLISWPFILTMAVNFFKWETISLPFVTIQRYHDSVRSNDILLFSKEPFEQLKLNIDALLNTTLRQKKDLPWNDIENFGTMFLFSMPFVLTGFIQPFKTKTDAPKGLALIALITGIWAGLLTNTVNVNRVNIIYYGIIIFAALGLYFVITEIIYSKWALLCMYAVAGTMLFSAYFGDYAEEIGFYFYRGFGEALAEAESSGAERIYVTADAQGKGYSATSEILTLFYDKTDSKYFIGKTNEQHGKELLPYDQRFIYESITSSSAARGAREDAAFVAMRSDAAYFDPDEFTITFHGNFCSAVKK